MLMSVPSHSIVILLAGIGLLAAINGSYANIAIADNGSSSIGNGNDLQQWLRTESVLVDVLRRYIDELEQKISIIKSKTLEFKGINDAAIEDPEKYVNNPINSLTLLKRFTSDWKALRQYAGDNTKLDEIVKEASSSADSLQFPTEDDLDDIVGNLLRIQDIYKITPERMAGGEMHGVKLGGEMSWSDCLEIGRKSNKNGDYKTAKYWIETAMGKLPTGESSKPSAGEGIHNGTSSSSRRNINAKLIANNRAKYEILDALVVNEFRSGNLEQALEHVNEMLDIKPKHKGLLKDKQIIEKALRRQADGKSKHTTKSKKQNDQNKDQAERSKKTAEELLIEEICREATIISANPISNSSSDSSNNALSLSLNEGSNSMRCSYVHGNLPQMQLQPLRVEYLSLDPFIVIYHNVLSTKQIEGLKELIEPSSTSTSTSTSSDSDENPDTASDYDSGSYKFTQMAKRKLKAITQRHLQHVTGHATALHSDDWQVVRNNFENTLSFDTMKLQYQRMDKNKIIANILFHLQSPKLGGAIVFPQLELTVNLPQTSLLYWSTLNEFHESDYRSKHFVCPVIAGTQISAITTVEHP